jgi:L,D-transpeptidase ErfK/SrfK
MFYFSSTPKHAPVQKRMPPVFYAVLYAALISSPIHSLYALAFDMPSPQNDIVGKFQTIQSNEKENFLTLGERYNIGYHELEEANPGISPWHIPMDTTILIPQRYILPKMRRGIVINLAELRLYYFPEQSGSVMTYPVGIGKKAWNTPVISTEIKQKRKNPYWYMPTSIQAELRARGETFQAVVPPGSTNPLGKYAMNLGIEGYLIHGTNSHVGIGLRITHGCIRLYPEDIEELYNRVPLGTPVTIINEPIKIGLENNVIFLESTRPLGEDQVHQSTTYNLSWVQNEIKALHLPTQVDWDQVKIVLDAHRGIPVAVGKIITLPQPMILTTPEITPNKT